MRREKLLEFLNKAVHLTAVRHNININTTSKPTHYNKYVKDMFNFLNHPEYHYLKKIKK